MPKAAEAALFFFGCFCALLQIPLGLHGIGFGAPYELSTVAANLASTGEFRDPFAGVPTGPTAHVAPLYPFLLATIIRVVSNPNAVIWTAIGFNACLLGISAALLPALARRIYGNSPAGVVGGMLLALSGPLIPQWEVALAALLLLAATIAILERDAGVAGLYSGASLLANPVSLPVLVVLFLHRGKRFAAIALMVAFALCSPWLIRNWLVLGVPSFVRDNFGLELYISNNDWAEPDLANNRALWMLHPNQNDDEASVVAAMGEADYNRMRLGTALDWIGSHPGGFLRLSAQRAFYYWLPPAREGYPAPCYWVLTVLAAAGTWMSRKYRAALWLAAAAGIYSLPFVVIQTVGRYRFPSLWMSALLAGFAVTVIIRRGRSILAGRTL